MASRELTTAAGLIASFALHGAVAWLLLRVPDAADLAPPYELTFEVGERGTPGAAARGTATDAHETRLLEPGSPLPSQNVDSFERGEHGDALGDERARILASTSAARLLTDTLPTSHRVSQAQRIRTARDRATREPERRTPAPGEMFFLANGNGARLERLRVARVDPAQGALRSSGSESVGGEHERPASDFGDTRAIREVRGGERDSPATGLARTDGVRESRAARVASARPPVDEGPANTDSDWQNAHVRDNHDAELLAAQLVESLVDASPRGGTRGGPGRGGTAGGGAPGSGGGQGEGGRSRAFAGGDGNAGGVDTTSPVYERWYIEQRRRIERGVVFPQERAFALDQGEAVYRVTVRRDGSLARPPELRRSSGHADFDAAALLAIRRALPFARLPAELSPSAQIVSIVVPIRFSNPMFR